MNKMIPITKRVGTVLLCLSVLCGAIMGTVIFPSNAEAETVKTFDASFADLAALVADTDYDANGLYQSKEKDEAINNWVDERFDLYLSREKSRYQPKEFLGQDSYEVINFESYNSTDKVFSDNWGGNYYWLINKDGSLQNYTGQVGDQMLRKSQTLTLKTDRSKRVKLANFKAEVVFNKAGGNDLGSVFVSFHETTPGRMSTDNTTAMVTSGNSAVIVGNGNGNATADIDGIILGDIAAVDTKVVTPFDAALDNSEDYKLTVEVVGTALTATVTKVADDSVVYTNSTTISAGEGTLSVGVSNSARALKSIKVTELDESGTAVDFGTACADTYDSFEWSVADKAWYDSKSGYYQVEGALTKDSYTFVDKNTSLAKPEDAADDIISALEKNFDVYFNHQNRYYEVSFDKMQAYDGQTKNYCYFASARQNTWLRCNKTDVGPQVMTMITSIVPKDQDGNPYKLTNFETTFTARIVTTTAAILVGFRQQNPGKFVNGYYELNTDQAMLVITRKGFTLAGGGDICSAEGESWDMYAKPDHYFENDDTIPVGDGAGCEVMVTLRAEGEKAYLKISTSAKVYYEGTVDIPHTEAGYISYGIARNIGDFGSISLTPLSSELVTDTYMGWQPGADNFVWGDEYED